jgi:hypothetical protein
MADMAQLVGRGFGQVSFYALRGASDQIAQLGWRVGGEILAVLKPFCQGCDRTGVDEKFSPQHLFSPLVFRPTRWGNGRHQEIAPMVNRKGCLGKPLLPSCASRL